MCFNTVYYFSKFRIIAAYNEVDYLILLKMSRSNCFWGIMILGKNAFNNM